MIILCYDSVKYILEYLSENDKLRFIMSCSKYYYNIQTKNQEIYHLLLSDHILGESYSKNKIETFIEQSIRMEYYNAIEWIQNKRYKDLSNTSYCAIATECGNLNMVKFLRSNKYAWNDLTCIRASQYGHINILQYAISNGCCLSKNVCMYAAHYGHLDILKYLRKMNCNWDSTVCVYAAKNGHLDILKYARENKCPWNKFVCTFAAQNGHLDVLIYAYENGCPFVKYECMNTKHRNIINWLSFLK